MIRSHIFLLMLTVSFATGLELRAERFVVTGGHYFDVESGEFRRNHGLQIDEERFVAILAAPSTNADLRQVTLQDDDFILPGIIDLHAHYNVNFFQRKRRDEVLYQPLVYLANGVTVTFPAGEFDPEGMHELRRRIERGEQIGPRLINSGPYFGTARPGWRRDMTVDEIEQEVDHWARMGVGGFKAKGIREDHLAALIRRAHFHGLTVTGHLDSGYRGSVNPQEAILLGIDRIEHFLGGDSLDRTRPAYATLGDLTPSTPGYAEIVALFVKHQVAFDATLTAYGYFGERREGYDDWADERSLFTPYIQDVVARRPPRTHHAVFDKIYWAKRQTLRTYFDAGGIITLGTDHVSDGEFLPGFSAHRELEALVLAGLPPAAALRSATIHGARALGIDKDHGSITAGKWADFLVIKGNPLESIRRTRTVHLVSRAGTLHRTAELLALVRGKLGPATAEEAAGW